MSIATQTDSGVTMLVTYLLRALIGAAAVCALATVAGWLICRPTQDVLAEADVSPLPESTSSQPTLWPSPTPTPKSTVAPTSIPPSPTPSPTAPSVSHTVREGETLEVIARMYGISTKELIIVNELANPDLLRVGQELALADSATPSELPGASPTTTPTDSNPIGELASPDEIIAGRWIDVDLSEQRLTAYEGDSAVRTTLVSTGLPNTPTPVGQFSIWIKLRYDDMAGADYYIEDVPYVMYFHEGYGLHGVTWHGNFGHPMSHGCVNLPTPEAEWLYNWAEVGTPVHIHQ